MSATRRAVKTAEAGYVLVATIINLFGGLLLTVLVLRLLFRLLGANATSGLVAWVYAFSEPFVRPFFGMFNQDISVLTGRFEFETFIALIVYSMLFALLTRIMAGPYRHHPTV